MAAAAAAARGARQTAMDGAGETTTLGTNHAREQPTAMADHLTRQEDTIFGRILRGEIPADRVHEDALCIAFCDVQPQAPVHLLVIPRDPLPSLAACDESHGPLLGHLLLVAARVAREAGLEGWRTVINTGAVAGQTVFHLHVHVIGGRPLQWPPG